jgi:hypothetical protein
MVRSTFSAFPRSGFTALVLLLALAGFPAGVAAAPFSINATLTGDGRAGNPDNLTIDVTIIGDDTSNVTNWIVDLTMDLTHPDAALHEFYFNMAGASGDYTLSNFNPATWSLTATDVNNANGSGNANFMFEVSGPNNTVTNAINLSFTLTKDTGLFAVSDFLTAVQGCSNDADLGCGQLGAHIGSLVAGQGESDSGFALGDYTITQAPEPVSALLFGTAVAFAAARRYRRRA